MNTIVIPETELEAQDLDKNDILFYSLREVTPVSTPTPPFGHPASACPPPGSQAVPPTSPGRPKLLLLGGCKPPRPAAGPATGLRQVAEHELAAAGAGECRALEHPPRGPSPGTQADRQGWALAGHPGREHRSQPHGHGHRGPGGAARRPAAPLVPALRLLRPSHLHPSPIPRGRAHGPQTGTGDRER